MISFTFLLKKNTDSINITLHKNWLKTVISLEGKKTGDIQYIFCDDNHLHKINKAYLNHDTLTDIITFATTNNENIISGEIYISIDRVYENANDQSVLFSDELSRVIVHGVLHLIGYDDHSISEKKLMREKEDYYLHLQQ